MNRLSIAAFSSFTLFFVSTSTAEVHTYKESPGQLLAPERGLYRYFYLNKYGYPEFVDLVNDRDFSWARKSGVSLISARVSLESFRDSDIPEAFLKKLEEGFSAVRDAGVKVILRFNYNNGDKPGEDASLSWILRHISQLKATLRNNADVIAVLQAGFLGAWGEWHSSTHGLDQRDARQKVLEALLGVLPKERSVQVRYPQHKEDLLGSPLQEATAHAGSNSSRTGHHNDCVLASENDLTYPLDKISYYRKYVALDSLFVPMGGETCKRYPPRTNCVIAQAVMKEHHYSYLNNNYRQEVIDQWRAEGCYEHIALHLGYRLVIRESVFEEAVWVGAVLKVTVAIENIGWAAPFNPRPLIVTLESSDTSRLIAVLETDARKLLPGKIARLRSEFHIPSEYRKGRYSLYISAPDPAPRLRTRYEYAMPFANEEYSFAEGRLSLGQISVLSR